MLLRTCILTLFFAAYSLLGHSSAAAQGVDFVPSKGDPVSAESLAGQSLNFMRHNVQALDHFRMDCDVDMQVESGPLAGACSISVLKTDSLMLTVTGPFGLLIGRLSAAPQRMVYFDALKTEVLEANPELPAVQQRLAIPLSYNDIIHLVRLEVPYSIEKYEMVKKISADSAFVYRYTEDSRFVDFVKCSWVDGRMLSYQRKSRSGEILLNINYSDYELMSGVLFPKNIVLTIPDQKTVGRFHVSSLTLNPENEHYSFSVPKGTKRTKLD